MARQKSAWLSQQHSKLGVSPDIARRANALGFTADEYVIYNLEQNDPAEYLSEYERYQYRIKAAGQYKILLDNKVVFYNLIRNFAPVNRVYAYKQSGHFHWVDKIFPSVSELVREYGRVVCKRTACGGGDGFVLLAYKDGSFYMNRKPAATNEVDALPEASDDCLLEEYCEQSDFENRIFPYAVNTLRIVTVENGLGGFKPIMALQRMGADVASCVDNASAGGIFSYIDLETGTMSAAMCAYNKTLSDKERYVHHPVTGTKLEGLVIPGWEGLLRSVIRLHEDLAFTGIPLVAWDIALTNSGFKVIEGNTSCSVDFIQRKEGHRNKEMGQLFRKHGIIK